MQKKGLAVTMVILLALTFVALVVMGFLIMGGGGTYTKSTSCENIGGKCVKVAECVGEESFLPGCEESLVCCIEEGD